MPIITPKDGSGVGAAAPSPMKPEMELRMICKEGKAVRRLERVLAKKPLDVNSKDEDGMTPLHEASLLGADGFVTRLLAAKADPNVPATRYLATPLDMVLERITYEQSRDERLNDFDQVNRLDDTCLAVRPDLTGLKACKKALEEAGGLEGLCFSQNPNVLPDGSTVKGGAPSALRAYTAGRSYTAEEKVASGKYAKLSYVGGMLVEE
mmetsp:Transcript_75960/g.180656  ORF Transcript_75960/g.180656 Transcript_75960/m.180656 type:complete len:208 (+) Transcript_75960:54-677(+)